MILLSDSDYNEDDELKRLLTIPFDLLDPSHSIFTKQQRMQILKAKYVNKIISDGLDVGLLKLNSNGEYTFHSRQNEPTFKGFIFEALIVRECNENKTTVGKNAYLWCTERFIVRSETLDKIKAFGRGFLSTKNNLPQLYNTAHKFDVQFYFMNEIRNEPEVETIVGTKIEAGIQVKAITTSEKSEIIDKILNKQYSHVLTCLRGRNGVHTYNNCMSIIRKMYADGVINREQRIDLERRIYSPEHLGINQNHIDDYSEYISEWWRGYAPANDTITDAANMEITGYKYEGSILVPDI